LKIATWNVNSLRVRLEQVLDWLDTERPHVLALQETKLRDEDFPTDEFEVRGYHAAYSGEPGYNGVALISREEAKDVATGIGGHEDPQRRVLAGTFGSLRVIDLYVPNGQHVDSDKYAYKLDWLAALRRHLSAELARHPYCVVLGDFNIAPEDRDVHDPAAWAGKVLCSPPEREALRAIVELGFVDSFRLFEQPERSFSWWDYRAGAFRRNRGLRIDLVLASQALGRDCCGCRIDAGPRGLPRPSDHAPVVAEFDSVTYSVK
jgi:exodeoxyribonuclease III